MATHNDITGDALVSRRANDNYRKNFDRREVTQEEDKVFTVYNCKHCHIKVSTSNGLCPCCQRNLIKEKQNAGQDQLATADGDTVSVPPVPSAGCTGQASESGSDNTEGSTA